VEDQFGRNTAKLREVIPKALVDANVRAREGHDGAKLATLDVYGHGLAVAQFEELANQIAALDGARMVKLRRYYLAVLDGWVFYPLRYADDNLTPIEKAQIRRPVSKLRRQLFAAHGPKPRQPALDESLEFPTAEELHEAFPQLGEDTRLCLVAYACNVNSGVLNAAWGEAELHADGSLTWHGQPQPLLLPVREPTGRTTVHGAAAAANGSAAPSSDKRQRFDAGEQPDTPVRPRTTPHSSPDSEQQPTKPKAKNHEGP
jgi:hypothetical protein